MGAAIQQAVEPVPVCGVDDLAVVGARRGVFAVKLRTEAASASTKRSSIALSTST